MCFPILKFPTVSEYLKHLEDVESDLGPCELYAGALHEIYLVKLGLDICDFLMIMVMAARQSTLCERVRRSISTCGRTKKNIYRTDEESMRSDVRSPLPSLHYSCHSRTSPSRLSLGIPGPASVHDCGIVRY